MSTPPAPIPQERLADLIEAMQDMRDALSKTSLMLQDHLFEQDRDRRTQATVLSDACIRRARSR